MIISISAYVDDEILEHTIYLCSTLDLKRLVEEVVSMDIEGMLDDDGIEYTETDPFLLSRIYLN